MRRTSKEKTAMRSCIKMWERMRDHGPPDKPTSNWEPFKELVYPESAKYQSHCPLCEEYFDGESNCKGCPLLQKDVRCFSGGPFKKLGRIMTHGNGWKRIRRYWGNYCQQIIDLCKKALEESE